MSPKNAPFHRQYLLAAIIVPFVCPLFLRAQISPGPLSKGHATLDSPLRCTSCHVFGAGKPTLKCTGCHSEIGSRLAQNRGYHVVAMKNKTEEHACSSCHLEHLGLNYRPLKWDPRKFEHREAGYELEGAHSKLDCRQCHQAKFIAEERRKGIQFKDVQQSYLGLDTSCTSCHADPHRNTLGEDCRKCHAMDNWKATPGFDHAKTRFVLTGKHGAVKCAECHKPAEGGAAKPFRGLSTLCENCHKDPHKRTFFSGCGGCHTTNNWKERLEMSGSFSHDSTNFRLRGKHVGPGCNECHKSADFGTKIPHQLCMDCHKDIHRNQFAARADKGECGSCHNDEGFKPANFFLDDHQKTAYKLLGMHSGVECAKCHPPQGKDTDYHPAYKQCLDCHKDSHDGQFQEARFASECRHCHTVESFTPSTYSPGMHRESRFPLKGAHAAVPCDSCHKNQTIQAVVKAAPNGKATFHFPGVTCTVCHTDAHNLKKQRDCAVCHNNNTWRGIAAFDHSSTDFKLEGAHQYATCIGCHKPRALADTRRNPESLHIVFREAGSLCADCHEDVHGGQFARGKDKAGCQVCHTLQSWRPPLFDHDKSTTFPLTGAHQSVTCRQCHGEVTDIDGRQVRMYRSDSRRCKDCH